MPAGCSFGSPTTRPGRFVDLAAGPRRAGPGCRRALRLGTLNHIALTLEALRPPLSHPLQESSSARGHAKPGLAERSNLVDIGRIGAPDRRRACPRARRQLDQAAFLPKRPAGSTLSLWAAASMRQTSSRDAPDRSALTRDHSPRPRSPRGPARDRPRPGARGRPRPRRGRRCSRSCSSTTTGSRSCSQLAHDVRMRWCGPEVEVEGIVSVKTGGCPEDCHFCSQSGLFRRPCAPRGSTSRRWSQAAKETAATGATEFCIVAAVRGPDERLMTQMREGVDGDPGGRRHQRRRVARHAHAGAGRRPRRHGRPPLQPQPRDGALVLSRTSSRPTRGRSAGTRCAWCATPAWRSAAAASSAWARRSSSAPSSRSQLAELRARRGAAELPSRRVPARRSATCR